MIPWWGWVLVLSLAFLLALVTIPLWFNLFLRVAEWFQHLKYARNARKHNARARELRLQRTEWMGLPLPTGKEGTLRITYEQLVRNPYRMSPSQMDRVYRDRGLDLKVDLEVTHDPITRDYVIKWRPHKGRWPRENY